MNNAIIIKQLMHKCLNLKLVTKTNSHNKLSLVNNFLWHYSQFRSLLMIHMYDLEYEVQINFPPWISHLND